ILIIMLQSCPLENPQGLRKLINAGINLPSYDSQRDFDYHYIHEVFSHLPNDYTNSHLEGWFKTNIWSVIVDCCLLDVGRKSSEVRKFLGRKYDGILRELGTLNEFAISEEGRLWDGVDRTKYLSDRLRKLPKMMRDTLGKKVKKLKLSSVISHQLEIVGFLQSGQYLQQLVMDIPCGSICRLRRYPSTKILEKLDEIDEPITMVNDMLVAK
ncbi:5926_t:CDS:2, partial [Funneliformis geosporum]